MYLSVCLPIDLIHTNSGEFIILLPFAFSIHTPKCSSAPPQAQAALLTKYLWIGKHCYESRNFVTAMQVLGGLENVIVRQLPVRLHLINDSSHKTRQLLQ